jgi:hypothetical protein
MAVLGEPKERSTPSDSFSSGCQADPFTHKPSFGSFWRTYERLQSLLENYYRIVGKEG